MKTQIDKRSLLLIPLLFIVLALFFTQLYFLDNKYETPPPYGQSGVISLTETDLTRNQPLFLVDGWLFSDNRVGNQPTYIGQFSNLQRGNLNVPPHGKATYQLILRYRGDPLEVTINFPQLFSKHIISINDRVLSQGCGGSNSSFTLTSGDHFLTVQTSSQQGYYSGMYHPPALAATETLFASTLIQSISYGAAFFIPLALAIFTLVLWRTADDNVAFWFGLLCFSFSLYVSYYFVRLLHLPFETHWFLVQSSAFYALCFCVVRLTLLVTGKTPRKAGLFIQISMLLLSALLIIFAILIPFITWSVRFHSILTDIYYIFTFCALLYLTLISGLGQNNERHWTILGCATFGGGLLLNLLFSNQFEPILFFWQFEWCGLFLVGLFGAMMVARNKRILAENQAFSESLEAMVEQRTAELLRLLQERKIFFADMAHDLKAPIFATKAFIQAIRDNDTGVDVELLYYIDQVEQKQQEMARRVQSLTTFNKFDSIAEQPIESISINKLIDEAYTTHHMAAEVASLRLVTVKPEEDSIILAPSKKLETLLENLIYNAIRATAPGGKITISTESEQDIVHITVADTGCGIPANELSHIFERFYVGEENKNNGSGLGLYIAKNIVDGLGGEILVSSKPNQGTAFFIDIPRK